MTYCKLLKRVDPRSRSPFAWEGRFFRPGSWIEEGQLWPDGTFPRTPLLVEFAGSENPARGHNRHGSANTVVLWRYDRLQGKFTEIGRVAAPAGAWPALLEPLVRDALRKGGVVMPVDLDGIRDRITRVISAELDLVTDRDRARVLTLVHDELACRLAEWGGSTLLNCVAKKELVKH